MNCGFNKLRALKKAGVPICQKCGREVARLYRVERRRLCRECMSRWLADRAEAAGAPLLRPGERRDND